jgi:signal transduction histidine kinase
MNIAKQNWPSIAQSFWAVAGAVSIRTKILGMVLGLMLILGFGITLQVRSVLIDDLEHHLEEESIAFARATAMRATDMILINDLFSLHELLRDTVELNDDVRYAFILDAQNRVIAHTFGEGFPPTLIAANGCSECTDHSTKIFETNEGRIWDTAVPISVGQAGVARVGSSDARINEILTTVTTSLVITTLGVSLVGVAAGGFLTWLLTNPILALVQAAQSVGRGDLSQKVERWADDEIGSLADAFNIMTDDLRHAEEARTERDRLRAQLLERVILAQEDERKRISRELHDETGQALTALMVGLRAVRDHCPDPAIRARATELRELASQTLDEVHNLALELRPSVLDDLGLVAALDHYVADYSQRYEIQVDFAVSGIEPNRLPAPIEIALYRIIQESLTNVGRHAEATTASVLIEVRNSRVITIIEDNGRGFDPSKNEGTRTKLGLYGMQERVKLLGGSFTIESTAGSGTSIFIDFPLSDESVNEQVTSIERPQHG